MTTATLEKPKITRKENSPTLVDSHNTLTAQFAKWIYKETMSVDGLPNGRIMSRERCAMEIGKIRQANNRFIKGGRVDYGDVTAFISGAREYLETNKNCTVWTIPGRGWRASTKIETAKYCGKTIRKTIAWAERARRVFVITDKKLLHHAIREVVVDAGGKITNLSGMRGKFLEMWGTYAEIEAKAELKQLSAPPRSK